MPMLILWALVAGVVASQVPPSTTQAPKPKDPTIQVRGCLHGKTVTLTENPGFDLQDRTLDLTADRRLMRALKEHNGHLEEFVGVIKRTNQETARAVKDRPVLELRAFSHVATKCR
jgi:hypothetical protein